MSHPDYTAASRLDSEKHKRGADKVSKIKVKIESPDPEGKPLRKPSWIRAKHQGTPEVQRIKRILREMELHTVCEEAQCPNLGECFGKGTATFMIMGDICTRRCPFCDVAHGRPDPLDPNEPRHLAETIQALGLNYVVITSVDRDDLKDGGAGHFADCIRTIRELAPGTVIEVLTPDFRSRMDRAFAAFEGGIPDVFNHNIETVPRLYRAARPGGDYAWSLSLLKEFKARHSHVPTKSGLMVGLGEEIAEVEQVMRDLRDHDVDMLTIGQYLQPSRDHIPVQRFVHPDEFKHLEVLGYQMGFSHVASGPMVRSSYHADEQASGVIQAAS